MTVIPPVAATQAGYASGGGIIDNIKGMFTGGAAPTQAGPKGDGSVGLFDGVVGKALIGGGIGAVAGFLPFIPGGPILGGIVGALGGAAMGVFGNFMKMQTIKKENEAQLAALGVQTADPQVQQILQSGNVSQLLPLMEGQSAAQTPTTQTTTQTGTQTGTQGPDIRTVTDPKTGISQQVDVTTGTVVQQNPTPSTLPPVVDPNATAQQSPVPTQGSPTAAGSGGMTAIGIPEIPIMAGGGTQSREALQVQVQQLQHQLDLIRAYLENTNEENQRRDAR
ncbi:MAG: hypothetical protein JWM90_1724 [Thermoleophilia bacterium]|nr:hypothetical protein [Thermoleophilia bacterium]